MKIHILIVAIFFLVTSACNAQVRDVGGYEIKDSGYLSSGRDAQNVYWLDNERVIFLGRQKGEVRTDGEQPNHLLIWNIAKGEVKYRAELSPYSYLCARGTYVRYIFERDSVKYVRFGEIWLEHETELDIQAE